MDELSNLVELCRYCADDTKTCRNCAIYLFCTNPTHLLGKAADAIEKLMALTPKWISVKDRLPENRISHLTKDSMYYPCIYQSRMTGEQEVRYYKFSKGHFWNRGEIVDNCVIAWSEPLLPPDASKGR